MFFKFLRNQPVSHMIFNAHETMPRNYNGLCQESFQKNVIVYRCVHLIAKSVSSVNLVAYKDDHEIEHHPLQKLLRQYMPYQMFMESLVSSYLLSGNAFVYCAPDFGVCVLRPDRVSINLSKKNYPTGYTYHVGSQKQQYGMPINTHDGAILHIKSFHPTSDTLGFSAVEAAAFAIDEHNGMAQHNLSLIKNGGRPSGALIVEDTELTSSQRTQLLEDLERFYQGPSNAGKMMVLEGPFKWQTFGLSPKDLDFLSGKSSSAREIASAFGVCPILVGLTEDATYSNYAQARLQLWEDTIIPLLRYILAYLNNWFEPFYNVRLDFDMDSIPALSTKRQETWNKLNACTFLTINEKRQAIGYSPLEDGDKLGDENQ